MRVQLESTKMMGRYARVLIDGVDVSDRVQRVEIVCDVHDVTRAFVTFLVDELSVDTEAVTDEP